jgi:hypothetical protein
LGRGPPAARRPSTPAYRLPRAHNFQNAAPEFFDGLARPPTGLAQNVNRLVTRATPFQKRGGVKIVQQNKLRARHVGGGKFAGRADIKQFGGPAFGEQVVEFARADETFGLSNRFNHNIII